MKQRKLERLILDLEDLTETVNDGVACKQLKGATDKLKEIYIQDYEDF
jgi:hypothetical protein